MSSDNIRLDKLEEEFDTMKEVLIRQTVLMETLADVNNDMHKIEIRLTKNESNWGIVKWLLGGTSGVALLTLALKVLGVI